MGDKRNELIADLYALRASISEISIKKDKLVELDSFIANPRKQLDHEIDVIKHNQKKLTSDHAKDVYKAYEQVCLFNRDLEDKAYKAKSWYITICVILFGVAFGLAYFLYLKDVKFIGEFGIVGGIVFTVIGIALGVGLGILLAKTHLPMLKKINAKEIKKLNDEAKAKEEEIDYDFKAMKMAYQIMTKENKEKTVDTSKAKEDRKQLLSISNAFIKTVNELYSPILDVRDWKYLDLVIYYIETKRADNIKEALLLIDEKIQHEELMNIIQESTESIVRSIQIAARTLDNTLKAGFVQVTNAINTFAETQHQDNIALLGAINESVSATELQTALMEKAKVQADYLMQDFNYLRDYTLRENW